MTALVLSLFLCLFLISCGFGEPEQGVVASINGRVVTLDQLEAMQDATSMTMDASLPQAAERLRREYGFALTELLVLELVNQQLEKKKIPVTAAEIAAEEAVIRGDYPGNSFDTMLREESIDLTTWRFLLKNHLAVQKFRKQILRSGISIASEEVEAYYHQNSAEFVRPAWVYYITISGEDKKDVEQGRAQLLSTADPAKVQREHPDLVVYTARMSKKRLAPELAADVAGLKPGQTTAVRKTREGFGILLLLDEGPEKRLTPTEAYPLIEDVLLDRKLQNAYTQWAETSLSKAKIRVTRHLLPPVAIKKSGGNATIPSPKDADAGGGNATLPAGG